MATSFQRRGLRLTIQLATGTFNRNGNSDVVTLQGFRMEVETDAAGGPMYAQARIRVYGMDQKTMDRLTVINFQTMDFRRNSIQIEATDENGQFTVIFRGGIFAAHPDYSGAPDVAFSIEAIAGLIEALSVSPSVQFPGAQRVSAIMARLASELNVTLEDNGVTATITDMVLSGSPMDKVRELADATGIQYWYAPEQSTLAIAPPGVARRGSRINFSKDTGMVGWPTKIQIGVQFTAVFNPAAFQGCPILIKSDITACNGEWYIISMSNRLSSEMPGGPWFTHFQATPVDFAIRSRQ